MIRLPEVQLPEEVRQGLQSLQASIDSAPTYSSMLALAAHRFRVERGSRSGIFNGVTRTLDAMCSGATRCMYCEDSAACEVEHFRPKSFYPDLVFVWDNYLFSCGNCNRIKGSRFKLHCEAGYVELQRPRRLAPTPPAAGRAVLIDPRTDDPLRYFSLDLEDTFFFVPRDRNDSFEHARATYTIETLKLNARDYLAQARRQAYEAYRARMVEYVRARGSQAAEALAASISRCGHRAVWLEMKAQAPRIPELAALFAEAPEAYLW